MAKVFAIDVAKCNGCYGCQIVCKDEHCGNDWSPYTKPQPEFGHFWCKVEEQVRGSVPLTRISYIPHIGAQTEALREYAPEALAEREDGLIVLDPAKCAGREDIAEKFEGVYWNEELSIPQGCTGCAHLLDNGWSVPRCVDACPTDAIRFGEEEELLAEFSGLSKLDEQAHVYYLNLPKRFIGATVVDYAADEVVIGAEVMLKRTDGSVVAFKRTDDFGDFLFDQVEAEKYLIEIRAYGYETVNIEVDATAADVNLKYVEMTSK